MSTFVILSTGYGAGKHMKDIPPMDIPIGLKVKGIIFKFTHHD
jgi:hypothetical protein